MKHSANQPVSSPLHPVDAKNAARFEADVRDWLEKAVIGLNLCPFARAPMRQGLIAFVVTAAADANQLLLELEHQALALARINPSQLETTLLIHPFVLHDFIDYNFFLDEANALVKRLDLEGVLQIASFHPLYQFAGTDADDVTNLTNRSPYPILHLLREESISRAVDGMQDPEALTQPRDLKTPGACRVEQTLPLAYLNRREPAQLSAGQAICSYNSPAVSPPKAPAHLVLRKFL